MTSVSCVGYLCETSGIAFFHFHFVAATRCLLNRVAPRLAHRILHRDTATRPFDQLARTRSVRGECGFQ